MEDEKTPRTWSELTWDERFADTEMRANYWKEGGRNEPDRARAVMNVEQAVNAWKNAAYAAKDELAALRAALAEARTVKCYSTSHCDKHKNWQHPHRLSITGGAAQMPIIVCPICEQDTAALNQQAGKGVGG